MVRPVCASCVIPLHLYSELCKAVVDSGCLMGGARKLWLFTKLHIIYYILHSTYYMYYILHTIYLMSLNELSVCHPLTLQYTNRVPRMHFTQLSSVGCGNFVAYCIFCLCLRTAYYMPLSGQISAYCWYCMCFEK